MSMRSHDVVMGRSVAGKDVTLDIFAPNHLLITGATRSGKSAQLYAILAQCKGLPVRVCGIDPSGIVFAALGDALGGDGWRVKTTRSPERCITVLHEIVAEMDRRIDDLLASVQDKIEDYTDEKPLLLVVFEEYPGLLAALASIDSANSARGKDRAELQLRSAVQRLALEGAKVGVKLVLLAQRADANLLTGVLRAQLTARMSFRQDADGLRMLHEGIEPEQIERMTSFSPGVGYVEIAGSMELTQYRADYIDYTRFAKLYGEA